jgi:8-oxo-dGTP pyrophosphatase MutT (NUDIX family)
MPFKKLAQKTFKLLNPDGYHKRIAVKLFELPNGLHETFFIDEDKDSVQVFCITKEADVVLVQQFRAGPEEESLELPGGGIEKGENPLHAGIRELQEETGYVGDATYMGSLPYSPYSSGRRHCVLVINAVKMDNQHLDPNEFVTVLKMSLRDFRTKIKSGSIRGWDLAYLSLDYLGKL